MLEYILRKMYDNKISKPLSNKEKVFFFKELSYLIKWGIWIVDALKIIWENSKSLNINFVSNSLISSLKKWETLSRSLTKLPKYFNDGDISIIRSWESSWELVNVLIHLSKEYSFLDNLKRQYISSLIYPIFLLLVSVFAVYITFTVILPWVISLVDQFDKWDLPFATSVIIAITEFLTYYNFSILVVLFLIVFGFSIFISTNEWRKWFDWAILNIPIIWELTRYYFLLKFFRYQKLLFASGMNYKDIFSNLKNIMNNYHYKAMIDDILFWIKNWESFVDRMLKYEVIIPKDIGAMVKAWEETANIDGSIENIIEMYEEEFNAKLQNIWKMIEPILIVVVWFVVAFIAFWVFSIVTYLIDSISI